MTIVKSRPSRENLIKNNPIKIEQSVLEDVINKVAEANGINVKKLASKDRDRDIVLARNMAYYILHTVYRQRASQIAPHFKRDRTTILHGLNTFLNDIEIIPFYMEKYESIMDTLVSKSEIYALK